MNWKEFIAKTHNSYMSIALSYLKQREDAEDVVWGVYGKLSQKNYPEDKMDTIGLSSVYNALHNVARDKKRRGLTMIEYGEVQNKARTGFAVLGERTTRDEAVEYISGMLTDRQYEALTLWVEGYNMIEIGEIMGITDGTAKSVLHTARNKIKTKWSIPEKEWHKRKPRRSLRSRVT